MLLFHPRSTGFILEGFPRTEAEARYLSSSGLFPDLAAILAVEDTEIVDRLLPPLLEKWRKKRDKREAEKEKQRTLAKKQKVRWNSISFSPLMPNVREYSNTSTSIFLNVVGLTQLIMLNAVKFSTRSVTSFSPIMIKNSNEHGTNALHFIYC